MPNMNLTPEERADSEARIKRFHEGLDVLRKETQCEIGYMPMYVPTGPSMFGTVVQADVIDMKYRAPAPSVLQTPPSA